MKQKIPMPSRDELEERYIRQDQSAREIASDYDTSKSTVANWIRQYSLYKVGNKASDESQLPIEGLDLLPFKGDATRLTIKAGDTFGYLTAREILGRDKDRKIIWNCDCVCGNQYAVVAGSLRDGRTTSCGCSRRKRGPDHKRWDGHGEIGGSVWNKIQRNQYRRGRVLDFTITIEFAWKLFLEQDRKCALTGLPIEFNVQSSRGPRTASLDRIDSNEGYVPGNVQWVHNDLNSMKQAIDENRFIDLCVMVAKKFGKVIDAAA